MTSNTSTGGKSLRKSRRNSETSVSASVSVSLSDSKNNFPQFLAFCTLNDETGRMLSDQGLSTTKERTNTLGRRIRDKSYFKGQIHLKKGEINDEIKKLQKEVGFLSIDRATYLSNRKRAEAKAMEIQNLQKTFADYNTVDVMLNTCLKHADVQLKEAKEELQNLKEDNKKENAEVEKLFGMAKHKEIIVKEKETDLSQENYVAEILTETPQFLEKYKQLKQMDYKLQLARMEQEKELKGLKKDSANLENACDGNGYLTKALESLKIQCRQESSDGPLPKKAFDSASEESEYLQKYQSECNDLLTCMQRENGNLRIKIKEITCQLKNAKTEESNLYNKRFEIYSKLKKKEDIIDKYLLSFHGRELALLTRQEQLRCKIIQLLKQISSEVDVSNLNPDSINVENAKTAAELKYLYLKLTSNLNAVNDRERELRKNLKLFKEKFAHMKLKVPIFENIENLKQKMKIGERKLTNQLKEMKKQKRQWKFILEDLQKRHDSLENKLSSNQTYTVLSNLEKQWHLLEEENFSSMENFIAFKISQNNYLLVKEEARKIYSELNKML